MRSLAIAALGLLLTCGTAAAQWVYQKQESAFDDDASNVALTAVGKYGFGVRCTGGAAELVFITPDSSFNDDTYEFANLTGPVLLLRTDNDPVQQLAIKLQDVDGTAVARGDADVELIRKIAGAKKRVSVALKLVGETYHEQQFNVRGSSKAIEKVIEACGLD